jgi:hypothetical protein
VYNWEDSFSHSVLRLLEERKAPQPFHRAPRARVACVRVLISVHFILLQLLRSTRQRRRSGDGEGGDGGGGGAERRWRTAL